MKKVLSVGVFLLIFISAYNQISDSCFYAQVDLANRWVWRSYSEAPVIQPSLGYANDKWNFLIWGSYPFERRAYSEIDFTVEYQLSRKLKFGITDFFGINDLSGAKHEFFNVKRKTTTNMLDAYFIYSAFNKIPVSILYSLWFWGADRKAFTFDRIFKY